jgi:excisionase family DNA binding protein
MGCDGQRQSARHSASLGDLAVTIPPLPPANARRPRKPVRPLLPEAEYCTVEQAAVLTGVSRATIYRMAADGQIIALHARGRTVFAVAAVRAAIHPRRGGKA